MATKLYVNGNNLVCVKERDGDCVRSYIAKNLTFNLQAKYRDGWQNVGEEITCEREALRALDESHKGFKYRLVARYHIEPITTLTCVLPSSWRGNRVDW